MVPFSMSSVLRLLAFLDHFDANRKLGHFMPQAIEVVVDGFNLARSDVLLGEVVDGGAQ
jgi:hypothetical protein